jgi:hypothetical protein
MRHSTTQTDVSRDSRKDLLLPPAAMAFVWSRTKMLKEVWNVLQEVRRWPDVAISPDPGGLCLALSGETLGHLRWSGRIDLPFNPEVGNQLVAEKLVSRDPDHPTTDKVVFDVHTLADVDRAVWLFRLAYLTADSRVDAPTSGLGQLPGARG